MRNYPDELADGLTRWLRGESGYESEAASITVAEVIIMHRAWLQSHQRGG